MNRKEYGQWLDENGTALTATLPIVFTPDKLGIESDDHQEPFLMGVRFGLGFAAKMARADAPDYEKMARNAHIAMHQVEGWIDEKG